MNERGFWRGLALLFLSGVVLLVEVAAVSHAVHFWLHEAVP